MPISLMDYLNDLDNYRQQYRKENITSLPNTKEMWRMLNEGCEIAELAGLSSEEKEKIKEEFFANNDYDNAI